MGIKKKIYDMAPKPLVKIWRLLKYPWVFMWNEITIRYFKTYSVCRMYRAVFGMQPNFQDPKSLNEKLQILKLSDYYDNQFVSACIDKYQVKDFLPQHFNVPNLKFAKTYAIFDNVKKLIEAGIENYPQRFMIKCNHGCGYNLLCDKDHFDISSVSQQLDFWFKHKHKTGTKDRPECFNEMIAISRKLSNPFPFVRVDLYVVKNDIYFSELTFLPTGGYMHILPSDILYEWGNYLVLKQQ